MFAYLFYVTIDGEEDSVVIHGVNARAAWNNLLQYLDARKLVMDGAMIAEVRSYAE